MKKNFTGKIVVIVFDVSAEDIQKLKNQNVMVIEEDSSLSGMHKVIKQRLRVQEKFIKTLNNDDKIMLIDGADVVFQSEIDSFFDRIGDKLYYSTTGTLSNKITFVWKSVVKEIVGDKKVEKVVVENVDSKKQEEIKCDGVFVFVGWMPNTELIKSIIKTDDAGYILANTEMETTEDGIFAAGDCIQKHLRQIVTACSDGATSAYSAMNYVDRLKGEEYV